MASAGNPNNSNQNPHFDVNNFFNPSNLPPPNPNNLGTSAFPPSYGPTPPNPSASYPPPAGPYSYPAQPPFYQSPYPVQDQLSSLQHQRSLSFPTPPLQPTPNAPPNPQSGARIMALLNSPASHQPTTPLPPIQPPSPGISEFSRPSSVPLSPSVAPQPVHTISAAISQPSPMRMPSSKLPKGRHLAGENVLYDVDVRLPGEVQPQLEVTPITKYGSDPGLILGHQIAVNKTYICYGLKLGNIRVLNINTALRSLLRGHTQRVTDMAFFAEDVHLLASGSIEGLIYVWKISEGSDEEDKPQISGNVVIALHIVGNEESIRPRVCWHCHKQEILVVAIGNSVLRIDTIRVAKGKVFTADEPLQCSLDKLIDGVQFVGKHEGEVTDLSMCQWMTTRLVSASKDGTVKIWEDRKAQPLLVLRPHDGQPVDAATFLTAPHRPDHIVLITAGPQNREVKLWASSSEEGWLLPSDTESWRCVQTLELKSSSEPHIEEAFFNQVVGLSQVGLVLLANAKKNAIYVVHLDYGANPAGSRMDYLAEFTVTMPILSFTGTSDTSPQGEHLVQVYCVQTQAIQQYALDLSQCLPPLESFGLEKLDSSISSHDAIDGGHGIEPSGGSRSFDVSMVTSGPKPNDHSTTESAPEIKRAVSSSSDVVPLQEITASSVDSHPATTLLPVSSHVDLSVASSPLPSSVPQSPRLTRKSSDMCVNQAASDFAVDRQIDNAQTNLHRIPSTDPDNRIAPTDVNPPVMFKHPTHLITPSEIMATSSAEATRLTENKGEGQTKIQDVVVNNESGNTELEVKVVGEAGGFAKDGGSPGETQVVMDRKERSFYSQASDLGAQMSREMSRDCYVAETSVAEETPVVMMEPVGQPSHSGEDDEADENSNDLSGKSSDHGALASTAHSAPTTSKGKKHKGKNTEASGPPSSSVSDYYSVEQLNAAVASSGAPSMGAALSQLTDMQNMLNQLASGQKEMQKQMATVVATPVTKEGRRLEAALGKSMEKAAKANADALWARIQEENAKHEKLIRERTQQITSLITNSFNKDFVAILDKALKKEIAAVSTNVGRTITPLIEKTVSSAIADSFQRGVGDKAVNQLERSVSSRIETIISRQIQSQFQTSGKQALQEGLKSVLEANVIPAFEMSCKSMFEQVDSTFRKGMAEHTAAVQHQVESAHSPLAIALREAVNSASSLSRTLSGELADGQRKLLAYATAGASTSVVNPLVPHTNGPLLGLHDKVEQPVDPTKELSRLTAEHKYEEAFTSALHKTDVSIVSWLCSQVDMQSILSMNPPPLSQGVLLALLQQLACDLGKETLKKLQWMTDVAAAINPRDPLIALHVRPICDQVYQILNHQRSLSTTSSSELASIRVITHVINSMLTACK